jgi:hypothetical protein
VAKLKDNFIKIYICIFSLLEWMNAKKGSML